MTGALMNKEETLLNQMVETIVREVSPEAIILFGSRVRGDARLNEANRRHLTPGNLPCLQLMWQEWGRHAGHLENASGLFP